MTVMTVGELLMEATKALEDSVAVDENAKLIIHESMTDSELCNAANTLTLGATYFALKSQAYSQLALARMQYESSTAV